MTAPPDLGPPETDAPAAEPTAPLGAWDRVKDHKLIQWAAAYLGAALAIGQAQDLVANAFAWPSLVGRVVVITLIVGFPIALTVAWYHGHRALRRISVGELSILSALVLIGALFFTVALRRDEGAPAPAAQALNATAAASVAASANSHELDEGFFNLMALRANVTNDDVLRQREFADVLGRIKGE